MPTTSIKYLNELKEQYGMTDAHFRRLHHMNDGVSIHSFRTYCDKLQTGFSSKTNEHVRERLCLVVDYFHEQGVAQPAQEDWDVAIRAALAKYPLELTPAAKRRL